MPDPQALALHVIDYRPDPLTALSLDEYDLARLVHRATGKRPPRSLSRPRSNRGATVEHVLGSRFLRCIAAPALLLALLAGGSLAASRGLGSSVVLSSAPTATVEAPAVLESPCIPGESHVFIGRIATLKAELGEPMGDPLECERIDPTNGDVQQQTSRGLAYIRAGLGVPTFTDGWQHWALLPRALVRWTGGSIEPPDDLQVIRER